MKASGHFSAENAAPFTKCCVEMVADGRVMSSIVGLAATPRDPFKGKSNERL